LFSERTLETDTPVNVSVIIPARNEEASLAGCLDSVLRQEGIYFEVIVVNDASTDRTRDIALERPAVHLIDAPDPAAGRSGKCNAAQAGADVARGDWLLFTDADTLHLPGSLSRALAEARAYDASLLSYSPAQEVHGLWENAVMPVIFAELACTYCPSDVCDPLSSAAAANGQYLLISREAYDAVGGHAAVAGTLLEDVALARAVKQTGRRIRFRFAGDAVRTRMYRTFSDLCEGWTKNLALLFPQTSKLALKRAAEFGLMAGGIGVAAAGLLKRKPWLTAAGLAAGLPVAAAFFARIRRAHFGWKANLLAPLGVPLFVSLLARSQLHYRWRKEVAWKGRTYSPGAMAAAAGQSTGQAIGEKVR